LVFHLLRVHQTNLSLSADLLIIFPVSHAFCACLGAKHAHCLACHTMTLPREGDSRTVACFLQKRLVTIRKKNHRIIRLVVGLYALLHDKQGSWMYSHGLAFTAPVFSQDCSRELHPESRNCRASYVRFTVRFSRCCELALPCQISTTLRLECSTIFPYIWPLVQQLCCELFGLFFFTLMCLFKCFSSISVFCAFIRLTISLLQCNAPLSTARRNTKKAIHQLRTCNF